MRNSCKQYNAATNKAFTKYRKDLITKLRKHETENLKECWKIIQGKQNSKVNEQISIETFQEYFIKLTSGNKTNHTQILAEQKTYLRLILTLCLTNLSLLKKLKK